MPARLVGVPGAQRAVGRLELGFQRDAAGCTRVRQFYQEGCLKARLPRPQEVEVCEAVTMNISGGVAGGDVLDIAIALGDGAQVVVASGAAERVYRALDGAVPARVATRILVAEGARLDYLPQETILFDGFALERRLDVELAAGAAFLGVESLVFGRQAMGEILGAGWLRDRVTLRRDGMLVMRDMSRLDGRIAEVLGRRAVAGGAMAMAVVIYAAADAGARLEAVRGVLPGFCAGASVLDGVLRVRVLAGSANLLRWCVAAVLTVCRDGRGLPRVWQS